MLREWGDEGEKKGCVCVESVEQHCTKKLQTSSRNRPKERATSFTTMRTTLTRKKEMKDAFMKKSLQFLLSHLVKREWSWWEWGKTILVLLVSRSFPCVTRGSSLVPLIEILLGYQWTLSLKCPVKILCFYKHHPRRSFSTRLPVLEKISQDANQSFDSIHPDSLQTNEHSRFSFFLFRLSVEKLGFGWMGTVISPQTTFVLMFLLNFFFSFFFVSCLLLFFLSQTISVSQWVTHLLAPFSK